MWSAFRLKKRDFEAAEHIGTPAWIILAQVLDGNRNRDLVERNFRDTWMSSQFSIRNSDGDMITRGQKDSILK